MYLILPLSYALIGMGILLYAAMPFLKLADARITMMVTNGKPGFTQEYTPIAWKTSPKDSDLKQGEIQTPAYGTQYGEIICEAVNLSAPLYFGDGEEELKKGAGQYIESAMPGGAGTILIGGHDSTYFAPLEQMKVGERIQIRTNNKTYHYLVSDIKIADADDSSAYELKKTGEKLILYTCYPFGEISSKREKRYFIYCDSMK